MMTYLTKWALVDSVDNEGAPCEWCNHETATVEATVYLPGVEGEDGLYECCRSCVLTVLVQRDASPHDSILIETTRP